MATETADTKRQPTQLTPQQVQQLFRDYHQERRDASEGDLDDALGLPSGGFRFDAAEAMETQGRHPGESIVNVATPYVICRGLIQAIAPGPNDRVLDLGCGDGRVVVYGALVCQATFLGVELVEERAANGRRAIEWLALSNASVVAGNVLDERFVEAFERATVFYAFRPFSVESEEQVLARLHQQGRRRRITVVIHRMQPSVMDAAVFERVAIGTLCVFRSRVSLPA